MDRKEFITKVSTLVSERYFNNVISPSFEESGKDSDEFCKEWLAKFKLKLCRAHLVDFADLEKIAAFSDVATAKLGAVQSELDETKTKLEVLEEEFEGFKLASNLEVNTYKDQNEAFVRERNAQLETQERLNDEVKKLREENGTIQDLQLEILQLKARLYDLTSGGSTNGTG